MPGVALVFHALVLWCRDNSRAMRGTETHNLSKDYKLDSKEGLAQNYEA